MARLPTEFKDWYQYCSFQTGSGIHTVSYLMSTRDVSPGEIIWAVKPNTHVHLAPRVEKKETIPPVLSVTSWCKEATNLSSILPQIIMSWEYFNHVYNKLQTQNLFGWKRMLLDVAGMYKENVMKTEIT